MLTKRVIPCMDDASARKTAQWAVFSEHVFALANPRAFFRKPMHGVADVVCAPEGMGV